MHPTVNNLKTFDYLTRNGIFPLPKNYKAIGVYHQLEKYDYSQSIDYLIKQGIAGVALLKIESNLTPGQLYQQNECSPAFMKLFEASKGVIFFGGPDIPPAIYGEPTSTMTVITDPHRHYMEISFLFHLLGGNQDTLFVPLLARNPGYCILGICLGMQSINVARGHHVPGHPARNVQPADC
jgi:putative glutamine amidotransferase